MAVLSTTTLLDYTVDPGKVYYSVGTGQLSIVTLTVTGTNNTAADVACSSISFTFNVGMGQGALTVDPTTIAVAPGGTTPWAVAGGNGSYLAVPLPPVTSIPAGSSVSFVFSGIVVNTAQGNTSIAIGETTDTTRTGSVTVDKNAVVPSGSTPVITTFAAAPAQVAQGGTTTLTWQVSDAQQTVLLPGPVTLPDPNSGTMPITVPATTTFVLRALGTGGQAQSSQTVTVMPVSITSFTADPATAVPAGTQVTLQWATQYAVACSIDQGVGPVPTSGTQVVTPSQSTVYTLSAQGLQPQARSITVSVGPS